MYYPLHFFRKKLFPSFSIASALLLSPALATAQQTATETTISVDKQQDILTLIHLINSPDMVMQILDQMFHSLRGLCPDLSDDYWTNLKKEMSQEAVERFFASCAPVYDELFTQTEIRLLIGFYQTPVGQKFLHAQPQLLEKTTPIIDAWAKEITQQVAQKVQQTRPNNASTPSASN